jgi:hypothetical protein
MLFPLPVTAGLSVPDVDAAPLVAGGTFCVDAGGEIAWRSLATCVPTNHQNPLPITPQMIKIAIKDRRGCGAPMASYTALIALNIAFNISIGFRKRQREFGLCHEQTVAPQQNDCNRLLLFFNAALGHDQLPRVTLLRARLGYSEMWYR